jgi:Leu/Phe-tRNA-protein transferase
MALQMTCACDDDRHDTCLNTEHCQCPCHKIVRMYHRGIFNWIETRTSLRELNCTDQMVFALIGTEEQDAAARAEAGIP